MKNIHFKQLANHSTITLEQCLYFKHNQKQYLDNKNITIEDIEQIKKEYLLDNNVSDNKYKTDDSIFF